MSIIDDKMDAMSAEERAEMEEIIDENEANDSLEWGDPITLPVEFYDRMTVEIAKVFKRGRAIYYKGTVRRISDPDDDEHEVWFVKDQNGKQGHYVATNRNGGWVCDCKYYDIYNICKHVSAVEFAETITLVQSIVASRAVGGVNQAWRDGKGDKWMETLNLNKKFHNKYGGCI